MEAIAQRVRGLMQHEADPERAPFAAEMNKRFWLIFGVCVAIWLSYSLYTTRFAMLDDALIHLRYAVFLRKLHYITYDGVHANYGASSLLYVAMLAVFSGITNIVLLPKIVSCVCYLLLIGILLLLVSRLPTSGLARSVGFGFLITALSPMGIRWLTDGMETSMVLLLAVLLAILTDIQMHRQSTTPLWYGVLVIFGFLLVTLRVELASLALLASLTIFAGRSAGKTQKAQRWLLNFLSAMPVLIGAVFAIAWIRLTFGSLLPDTALAKGGSPSFEIIWMILHVIVSSIVLGVGATLLYLVSALLVLRSEMLHERRPLRFVSWALANGSLPLIVLGACLYGQSIQGIRYLLWTLFFPGVWNMLQLERYARAFPEEPLLAPPGKKTVIVGCTIFMTCILPVDGYYAMRAMRGRAAALTAMRNANLGTFRGKNIVAGDVGFIGYFTGANVCDIQGLVNGRKAALEEEPDRISRCADQRPVMAFLTNLQAEAVNQRMSLKNWIVCQAFGFMNVGGNDRHYEMVPRDEQTQYCVQPGGPLGSAIEIIPGLE